MSQQIEGSKVDRYSLNKYYISKGFYISNAFMEGAYLRQVQRGEKLLIHSSHLHQIQPDVLESKMVGNGVKWYNALINTPWGVYFPDVTSEQVMVWNKAYFMNIVNTLLGNGLTYAMIKTVKTGNNHRDEWEAKRPQAVKTVEMPADFTVIDMGKRASKKPDDTTKEAQRNMKRVMMENSLKDLLQIQDGKLSQASLDKLLQLKKTSAQGSHELLEVNYDIDKNVLVAKVAVYLVLRTEPSDATLALEVVIRDDIDKYGTEALKFLQAVDVQHICKETLTFCFNILYNGNQRPIEQTDIQCVSHIVKDDTHRRIILRIKPNAKKPAITSAGKAQELLQEIIEKKTILADAEAKRKWDEGQEFVIEIEGDEDWRDNEEMEEEDKRFDKDQVKEIATKAAEKAAKAMKNLIKVEPSSKRRYLDDGSIESTGVNDADMFLSKDQEVDSAKEIPFIEVIHRLKGQGLKNYQALAADPTFDFDAWSRWDNTYALKYLNSTDEQYFQGNLERIKATPVKQIKKIIQEENEAKEQQKAALMAQMQQLQNQMRALDQGY